jgi:transketolase
MNNASIDFRKEIGTALLPHARKDPDMILMVCDMGFGVTDQFKAEFPDRIFNMGMAEQATVGMAAGMAMSGLKPIVYSIVNFLVFRSLEQIRNDVVNQRLNVKFIATGVNNYFKFLGPSHCCGQDDIKIMEMIGLRVFDPYSASRAEFTHLVEEWISSSEPGYLRL